MNVKWYTDNAAKLVHQKVEACIKDMCAEMFRDHLFTHLGINRNEFTNEIVLKIHLRPIGEAVFVRERFEDMDTLKLGGG